MKLPTRLSRLVYLAVFVCLGLSGTANAAPAAATSSRALSQCDPDGIQDSGALYRICSPSPWYYNGDLVIFAHGYVGFNEPLRQEALEQLLPRTEARTDFERLVREFGK